MMGTDASATIDHLAVHWVGAASEARTPATRLRLERLLNMANLRPPGMPAGALLIIRYIDDLPPLARIASVDLHWIWQVERRVAELYHTAERPTRGRAAPHARSVLFDDAAMMLALLTREMVQEPESCLQRWYWRKIVADSARWPGAVLAAAWSRHAEALPAALTHLTCREVGAAVALLSAGEVSMVTCALHNRFALPPPPEALPMFSAASWPEAPQTLPPSAPAASAEPLEAPWRDLLPAAPLPRYLAPHAEYLPGLALTLYRNPAWARSLAFAEQAAAWLHAAQHTPNVAGNATEMYTPPGYLPPGTTPQTSPSVPVPGAAAASPPMPAAPPDESTPAATVPPASYTVGAEALPTPAGVGVGSGDAGMPEAPMFVVLKPVIPEGITTDLGGVLYLINLLIWMGWSEQAGLSGWSMLEALARGLLNRDDDDDPLWMLLARLEGREPGTPLSSAPVPEQFRLPLKQVPSVWVVVEQHERVHILAAEGGYLIADMPRHGRTAATIVQAEMAARGLQATWQRGDMVPYDPLPDRLRAWLGSSAAFHVERMRGYIQHTLEQLLRDDPSSVLYKSGRIVVSHTHIDLFMNFEQISIAVRRAGLDGNPGWVPELGYIVLFHFVEEEA